MSDLNRAIEWYEKFLGFKVTGTWPPEKPDYAHFETADGAQFSVMEDERVPSNGRYGNELGFVQG